MKIKLLLIGKTKEAWCEQGEQYYLQKIAHFCDIEKIELPEEKITASVTDEMVKQKEGERLLKAIPDQYYSVALSPGGKILSSPQFADFLGEIRDFHGGKLCFLVGGPLGLSDEVLGTVDKVLSFSHMTFPHDLFRIMLSEQVYRGFSLLAGKKYHK